MRNQQTGLHKTKRTVAALSVLLLALSQYGCPNRDFPDPNAPSPATLTLQSFVTGLEAQMRVVGTYLIGTGSVGREMIHFGQDDPRFRSEYIQGQPDPGGGFVSGGVNPRYRAIAQARLFLERVASAGLSPAQADAARGFANTIIAYQYLLIHNWQYDNGMKFEASTDPAGAPIVPRAEAIRRIAALLDEADQQLSRAGSEPFPFRLSSGFAGFNTPATFRQFNRGLRARVAAYQGDYATCLAALAQSFISSTPTEANMQRGVYHVFSTAPNDATNPLFQVASAPLPNLWVHPSFFRDNTDTATDRRLNKIFRRETRTFEGLTSSATLNIAPTNVSPLPILRNEELLLLRAEARILGGSGLQDFAAAEADLNAVRQAAGVPPYPAGSTNATNALDRLIYERRYSLFMEGHRWVDMRRFPTRPGSPNPNNLPGRLNELPLDRPTDRIIVSFPIPIPELPPS
ncbi:MAG: RagB/SusD family nutrient uptake outer membrane protein [Chloroherpetonaceae bacterium]|nr:RagB/SusD family nutrient uptake outer membrane protein [Chloroherpetonaceae bacterium]MCS7210957.1 RagB/SusD family nutrient uptake outer membrane protein [Chloroherpetonaceae bacterium]MDW8020243.1 RagB/SusD family nutrient uptake outer membrane protein [Chloroherpetonaceae bacterium]